MNYSRLNCTMEDSYQNRNIRMFSTLTSNPKCNRFTVYTVSIQTFCNFQFPNLICYQLIQSNPSYRQYNSNVKLDQNLNYLPKKYLRSNFIKKDWSLKNNESHVLDSIDSRSRISSQNNSKSIVFSNQTVRERTQNQSFSQKNNINGLNLTNQTPLNKKKISQIDINQSFNQFLMSTQSVSAKRPFKKPKINQNLNQTFYKQLFPSQKPTNRAFKIMKSILFNESKGAHNYTYSNMLFNQKYRLN